MKTYAYLLLALLGAAGLPLRQWIKFDFEKLNEIPFGYHLAFDLVIFLSMFYSNFSNFINILLSPTLGYFFQTFPLLPVPFCKGSKSLTGHDLLY